MDEEVYLNWVLLKSRGEPRSKKNLKAIKRKVMVYMLVPRGTDININEPLGMRPSETVSISYAISGILLSYALTLFM